MLVPFAYVLTIVTFFSEVAAQNPSPCPDVFTYDTSTSQEGRWYGIISLQTSEDLVGVLVHVILDRPAELLGNWLGASTSNDNKEFVITNPTYHLEAGPPVSLKFFIKYNPQNTVPSLVGVRLNGKPICPVKKNPIQTAGHLHISQTSSSHTQKPTSRPNGNQNTNRPQVVRPSQRPNVNTNVDNRPSEYENENYGSSNAGRPSTHVTSDNYGSSNAGRPTSTHVTNEYESGRPTGNIENSFTDGSSGSSFSRPTNNNFESSNNNYGNTNTGNQVPLFSNTREPVNNYGNTDYNTNTGSVNKNPNEYEERPASSTNDNEFFPGDFAISRPISKPTSSTSSVISNRKPGCGTVSVKPTPLISYGMNTSEGQWPWHVALYNSVGTQLTYTCGGSLISENYVLTAAHCVTKPQTSQAINPQNLLIYLGKHDLKKFGAEIQNRDVSKIIVHHDYNHTVFHNDIALLKLARPAEITNHVRTVCLWSESTDLNGVLDKLGTVIGWGFDEDGRLTSSLMQARMPVVSSIKCVYSNPDFFSRFTFDKSYCAGFRNGTSVCNGDSGGGMVFLKSNGQSNVWQIRGLVSVGVALQGKTTCDPSHYIVFTDVAKHLDWIRNVMNQR